jgi:hypothetical protein
MPELEAVLRELGNQVEFPPTPDLAPAVRNRLRRRRSFRRPVAIALAVLVVVLGAVLAVPSARTALLDWLGIKGARIVRVEKLPPAPVIGNLDLGRPLTLAEARRRFRGLVVPKEKPDRVYLSKEIPGGKITLIWGSPIQPRLLLTEFRGEAFIEKLVRPETKVERVEVNGAPGAWVEGQHVLFYRDREGQTREDTARLAGRTLLWQRGDVTLRLEGRISRDEALRIARLAS